MVSTRPSPSPVRGRISYPTASSYTPGDAEASPYLDSEPIQQVSSRESQGGQNIKTWWKGLREDPADAPDMPGVFGVALQDSVEYASVQISTAGPDDRLYVWGVIPVVVAKCGLFLKENATEVEGTFRISGSAKRMRELQDLFDNGPKVGTLETKLMQYGKDIEWKELPFTSHDVATIFRRFLTQMPESVVPIDFYEDFRAALDETDAIRRYKELIRAMPPVNQYLLLYVLDLLSVFARKAEQNLMTAPNLALIFQPGMLSHPSHAMRPSEHVLSQHVLEFLIEHQDHFLVGMELKPKRKRTKSKKSAFVPEPLVKADEDMMIPSDSDDEAPAGGYYVFESKHAPKSPPPPEEPQSPPPPPAARPLSPPKPQPVYASMQPSDSDEEPPVGGYEVRSSSPSRRREGTRAPGAPVSRRVTTTNGRVGAFTSRLLSKEV